MEKTLLNFLILLYKKYSLDNNFRGRAGDYDMKKIFFVFLSIFSLLIINGKEYECEAKKDLFNEVERYVLNEYEFIQNGMKLEYTTKVDIYDELDRIDKIFQSKNELIVTKDENSISVKSANINYSVNIYNYSGLTKVEVIVINTDKNLSESYLRGLVEEIRGSNFINERYFSFIKGKIKTEDKNIFEDVENKLKIKINENLDISNGSIAKATMIDGTNLNIGQITYDTGSYLIIGTPTIFVTY